MLTFLRMISILIPIVLCFLFSCMDGWYLYGGAFKLDQSLAWIAYGGPLFVYTLTFVCFISRRKQR